MSAAVEDEPVLTFDASRKKKKKRTPFAASLDSPSGPEPSAEEKPARSKVSFNDTPGEIPPSSSSSEASTSQVQVSADLATSDRDYTYEELVDRIFATIENKNPDMLNRSRDQRVRVPPPTVMREGTRRTVWVNFADTAQSISRSNDHLKDYVLAELGVSGTLDAENRLTIRGRFQPKQIQTVVRHYIAEYVVCQGCRSAETELTKENRIYFLHCKTCNSRRSVATIKQGFVAQVGRRKRN